ncbi:MULTISPECIES: PTS lactose/cellobiose transporter subunit IIA [Neobacillus]|uniref:PTS lactose/cellobiose transporter subunit IIA n=1 Tax=Neobacillus rhizophilus TaxID=2833579 RepID=A0A942U506_9BACI|nr:MULTISPECIES: PTS lactose/cellobiose transporter subunit IIA [Neobacillus]MBS4212843.1 PTS lactose/cellobiose transporter subunit IIA [Neobacillus rhizophilus]MBU8919028.1 PTS lactose/cellobiose transporter subunit IIA [Bacillus sp. FJAT-29953]
MLDEKTAQNAMQIILHAGDARVHCMNALKAIENSNFTEAKEEMKRANDEIVKAHRIQTNTISAETQGEAGDYSVLFAHAQDTLMTIYSEINIAKRMIKIFETFDARLAKLEQKEKEDGHE